MILTGTNERHQVILEKGQSLMAGLTEAAKELDLKGGQITGIGAVTNVDLGAYDTDKKEYIRKNYSGIYELVTLTGNISWNEDKPFVHAHVCLGDHHFQLFGGHLFEAEIAVTGEFFVNPLGKMPAREFNESIGLSLICKWADH